MDARRHQEIAENAREAASGAEGGADPVPVADKIGKVAAENQYIIFAENNHFDAYDNAMLITSDKVMQTMADGGVKHVMMGESGRNLHLQENLKNHSRIERACDRTPKGPCQTKQEIQRQ